MFGSQLIRYFRIINSALHFKNRISKLVDIFISLGYNKKILKSKFVHVSGKYSFVDKFQNTSELMALFD